MHTSHFRVVDPRVTTAGMPSVIVIEYISIEGTVLLTSNKVKVMQLPIYINHNPSNLQEKNGIHSTVATSCYDCNI